MNRLPQFNQPQYPMVRSVVVVVADVVVVVVVVCEFVLTARRN